jgi:ribosomal subunit interface protein
VEITVAARHGKVDEELRDRAVELLERTARSAWRPHRAEIVFDNDHKQQIVELHLHMPGGKMHVASAEASDCRTAIDRAIEKLRNQLDKLSSNPDSRRQALGEK